MDKTVNAGDDVSECAEGGQTYDLSLNDCALGIISLKDLPRIVVGVLEAERDLLGLLVDILNIYLNGIANVHDLAGMLDMRPGKLGNMYHTEYAAKVYERAVACE